MAFDDFMDNDLAQIVPFSSGNGSPSTYSDFAASSPANSSPCYIKASPEYPYEELTRFLDDVQQVPFFGSNVSTQNHIQQNFYRNTAGCQEFVPIKTEPRSLLDLLNTPPVAGCKPNCAIPTQYPMTTAISQPAQMFYDDHVPNFSIERVQEMALRQTLDDSIAACKSLRISTEPLFWSHREVHAWLLWAAKQYNLGYLDLNKFNFDGFTLCQLDENKLKMLAPSPASGEVLYSLLHLMSNGPQIKQECHDGFPVPPAASSQTQFSSPSGSLAHSRTLVGDGAADTMSFWTEPHAHSPAGSLGQDSGVGNEPISDDDEPSEHGDSVNISNGSHTHLWQFLKELLGKPALHGSAIRWIDRSRGIFKIEDSVRVARLWGKRKNRPAMNYDKLSRSIRQYYKKGIMKKTERSQRLVYQFCAPYAV